MYHAMAGIVGACCMLDGCLDFGAGLGKFLLITRNWGITLRSGIRTSRSTSVLF